MVVVLDVEVFLMVGVGQNAHYGGCMMDDDEFEDDYLERKNNLSVGNVKYTDYNKLELKKERNMIISEKEED